MAECERWPYAVDAGKYRVKEINRARPMRHELHDLLHETPRGWTCFFGQVWHGEGQQRKD